MKQAFHLHLISDSTGETAIAIARAACAQFEEVEAEEHLWSLVRTKNQLGRIINNIKINPGVVLYSLVDIELRKIIEEGCEDLGLPAVALLDPTVEALSNYLQIESVNLPGGQHIINAESIRRIEAMNFALAHDDGQGAETIKKADVILVGVSRTSKTPTCFYLANRGLKAANIPYVPGCPLPVNLSDLRGTLVVGLTRNPDQLVEIRRTRLSQIGHKHDTNYVKNEIVDEEVKEARRLFSQNSWHVIDVSQRSIEEIAAAVLQLYSNNEKNKI